MREVGAAMLAVAVSAPALAQTHVATLPIRDVSVTYHLEGSLREAVPGGLPETVRLLWDAAGRRLRVEAPGRTQILLVDLAAPRAELIDTGLHGVITLPMKPKDVEPITLAEAHLTRRGAAVVAGLPCTEYDVTERRGSGTICLTADGVALRGRGTVDGREGSFVAQSVTQAPVAESAFSVPPGYMRLGPFR